MKNIILFLTVFTYTLSFAQQKKNKFLIKGTTEITGDISLLHNNSDSESEDYNSEEESFYFNFSPNFGYAIKDNLIVGIGAGYEHNFSKSKDFDDEFSERDYNYNGYSVFPYLKKYFSIGKKVALSLRGELKYSHRDYKSEYHDSDNLLTSSLGKHDEYFIGIRPGVSVFVTKNLLLKANLGSIGYSNKESIYNINENDESKYNSKRFNFLLNSTQFSAGLTFLII